MILNKKGETLKTERIDIVVGDYYGANSNSEYCGLYGKVSEIRTNRDKDTDNIGPDIYVKFGYDEVIMAEDMLEYLPF